MLPNNTVARWITVVERNTRIAAGRLGERKPMPIDTTTNIAPISVAAAVPISAKKSCHAESSDAGTRRSGGAQFGRRRLVDGAVDAKRHAVFVPGKLGGDQPVRDVERDLVGIARRGIAEPAAARQFEADEIAAGNRLPTFRAHRLPRDQRRLARRAESATVAAARRVVDTLEIAQHRDRHVVGAAQFDDLAEAAAITPDAARALTELAAAA